MRFFGNSRALCQGHPLSLLLFLLVLEVLTRMLKRTEEGRFICGFQVGINAPMGLSVTHLLFANETILFCDASREQLLYIKMVLIFFEVVISLKVNIGKSGIVPIGEVGNLNALSNILY